MAIVRTVMDRLIMDRVVPRPTPAQTRRVPCQTADVDDEELLDRAEQALTEIKVAQGLSEPHEAVLAALRIRLKGSGGASLEDMLEAAEDTSKPSLDDLFAQEPAPKPDWPS
jgi:hypothetical protein